MTMLAESAQPYYTGPEVLKVRKDDVLERRRRYLTRWTSIKAERTRQWAKWQDLTDFILPERGRFLTTDHNKPKDTSKILNNTPTRMCRMLAAGLMSGVTSPARPWFNLTLYDEDLAGYPPVKQWLWEYSRRMRKIIDLSGFYRAMAMGVYPDLGAYGLGTCLHEEDPVRVMRFSPLALGTYGIAGNGIGEIDTLFTEEPWTVGELVKEFGWDKVSPSVRTAWNGGVLEQYVLVLRVIEPNAEFIPGAFGRKGMKWGSVWMEIGGLGSAAGSLLQPSETVAWGFLREAGYEEFPGMCARWSTTARDVYPTGPGHDALPDAKQIMVLERRKLLAISKGVNPAMLIPDMMRQDRLTMLPGDPVYVPSGMNQEIKPAQMVEARFVELTEAAIRQVEQRVGEAFFAPLLMSFIGRDPEVDGKEPITAAEVAAKHSEIMLQLGPVLENLNDFLSRFIDRTAAIMERRRLIPPPPKGIQGMRLKVEFISILFQAQKMVHAQIKQQMLGFVAQMVQLKGLEAADNIRTDQTIRAFGDDTGYPPDLLATDEEMQQVRQQRQQQQQAMQKGQAMLATTQGAKNLGDADTSGDSMLSRLVGPVANAEQTGGQ